MQVLISSRAYRVISHFVRKYQNYLTKPLFDTGIAWEELMRKQYVDWGSALGNTLLDHVREYMSRDVVGYERMQNGNRLSVTRSEGRLLFIEYTETTWERKVEHIKIFRK